jgi:hypothetical protein
MNKLILTKHSCVDYSGELYKDNVLIKSFKGLSALEIRQECGKLVGIGNFEIVRISVEDEE